MIFNIIFWYHTVFFLFLVLFQWKREGFAEFRLKKRKLSLTMISTTKTGRFCVKCFHMMKGVKIKCFLTLKTPKIKNDLSFRRFFFVSGWLWVLGWFFAFWEAIDWLYKVPKVFPWCFGLKVGWKNKSLVFPATTMAEF